MTLANLLPRLIYSFAILTPDAIALAYGKKAMNRGDIRAEPRALPLGQHMTPGVSIT